MKKFLAGVLIALMVVLVIRSCIDYRKERSLLGESSDLIEQRIKNVSKLIVTEGHFAEVYNYKDSRELFGPLVTADKKALVVCNAEVMVAYDLSQLQYQIDETTKTLHITAIPDPEIKINPDFEYYDVTADYLNPFKAEDYNLIKEEVKASLRKKIEASSLKTNAQNRLLSELAQLYVLTKDRGWTLTYSEKPINGIEDITLWNVVD